MRPLFIVVTLLRLLSVGIRRRTIAASKQANELLNWEAKNSDLNTILKSMWNVYNPEVKHD